MKRALFIDRDGTIIKEPPVDFQVDSLEKLEFCKYAISGLKLISLLDYEMVMVSNQDGRGTESFPEEDFIKPHSKMLSILKAEDIIFDKILIDNSFEYENSLNRKPRTGMLREYLMGDYLLSESYVIGDRLTDIELAKNMGAKAIYYSKDEPPIELREYCHLATDNWYEIYEFLRFNERVKTINRTTKETSISTTIDLDGKGSNYIDSGLKFFNHMLEQLIYHSGISIELICKGDLEVDEHHTVEDIAIVLGQCFKEALADMRGIERYGFALPMDECDALVLLDLGGRYDFLWDVEFQREKIGDTPTEMFEHFFKSFAQNAMINLHISAKGKNEHHKIEGIFKAFARTIKSAIKRDIFNYSLPSSKGVL